MSDECDEEEEDKEGQALIRSSKLDQRCRSSVLDRRCRNMRGRHAHSDIVIHVTADWA